VIVTAPDGRTMTVRYCRPGGLLGVMSLFTTGFVMPAATQALVEATDGPARRDGLQAHCPLGRVGSLAVNT
jgi:hypothetical protein